MRCRAAARRMPSRWQRLLCWRCCSPMYLRATFCSLARPSRPNISPRSVPVLCFWSSALSPQDHVLVSQHQRPCFHAHGCTFEYSMGSYIACFLWQSYHQPAIKQEQSEAASSPREVQTHLPSFHEACLFLRHWHRRVSLSMHNDAYIVCRLLIRLNIAGPWEG